MNLRQNSPLYPCIICAKTGSSRAGVTSEAEMQGSVVADALDQLRVLLDNHAAKGGYQALQWS